MLYEVITHLEIVNPVVIGSVRARMDRLGDKSGKLVLPITIHGDSAIAGQGVVAESLNIRITSYNVCYTKLLRALPYEDIRGAFAIQPVGQTLLEQGVGQYLQVDGLAGEGRVALHHLGEIFSVLRVGIDEGQLQRCRRQGSGQQQGSQQAGAQTQQ